MRLSYAGIEADTPQAAAIIASGKPTDEADNIDDCEGENLAALVDTAGDADYEHSVTIDFSGERARKAARALLDACRLVIARWELGDLAEAARACQAAVALATDGQPPGISAESDIHALVARQRHIADIWSIDDVQEIRPDLSEEQAWDVLQRAQRKQDAEVGINWDVLGWHAEMLFGAAPDAAGEE